MTQLPFNGETNLKVLEPEKEYFHNWLYSVIPVFMAGDMYNGLVLLAGYCRICDQAFSKHIPWDADPNYTSLTKMNIPKTGCIEQTR